MTHQIPAPTGNRIADLLEERRATINEMRRESDQMAREMIACDVERIDEEIRKGADDAE